MVWGGVSYYNCEILLGQKHGSGSGVEQTKRDSDVELIPARLRTNEQHPRQHTVVRDIASAVGILVRNSAH